MKIRLEHIAIVLNEPHFPENIGAAARAVKNMGMSRLVVVNPIDCDLTRILKMATHNAEDVVVDMEVHNSLEDALAPFQYVVGTTARIGSHRQSVRDARQIAVELIGISAKNRVAILFGTESRGLANEHLKFCDTLVTIPTADFSSINLAQSVMILAYEIFTAASEKKQALIPRLADRGELEGMYGHLKETLTKINFINPENPDYWMINIRKFFSRLNLRGRDVRIIRGICRQIDWYCHKRGEPSRAEGGPDAGLPISKKDGGN
ncbi:MAG: RNA methyltransferase [Syntrophobacteraceae bacterium]